MHSKIQNDIKELVEQQVISQDMASKIEAYYQSKKDESPNRLFVVFGVLGSLLVGLGIILILAHNWDNFSRPIKTIIAFVPLAIGQLAVGFSILKQKSNAWKESSGVFLFFAVGASMAMVSQIYNIPGNLSSYLLTWIILCLPLIYLLKSHALALLHLVFATYYACEVGYFSGRGNDTPWMYLVFMLLLAPYYYKQLKDHPKANITSIFNWLVPISFIITIGAFITIFDELIFLTYIVLFGLFYNVGKLPMFNNLKLRQNGYLVLGSFGTVVLLLIASFRWIWDDVLNGHHSSLKDSSLFFVLFVLATLALVYAFIKKQVQTFNVFHYVFVIMTIMFFIGLANDVIPTIITNFLLFFLGLNAIKIGADKMHFGVLNYGLIIISALITCRFFDTNMGFEIKGLLFVLVGVGFFAANYFMIKKRKDMDKQSIPSEDNTQDLI